MLNITGNLSKTPLIKPVFWHTDGSTEGSPSPTGCGGVFRICHNFVIGCFIYPLDIGSIISAEDLAWAWDWRKL